VEDPRLADIQAMLDNPAPAPTAAPPAGVQPAAPPGEMVDPSGLLGAINRILNQLKSENPGVTD
jgi:hypothetical protein